MIFYALLISCKNQRKKQNKQLTTIISEPNFHHYSSRLSDILLFRKIKKIFKPLKTKTQWL